MNKDATGFQWFLNLASDEGAADGRLRQLRPQRRPASPTAFRHSDGSDAIFGDLGNDWMVGGTGQDTLYGGWGNDLMNADDVMTIPGLGVRRSEGQEDPAVAQRHARHPSALRRPGLRRRRPRRADRQHRRRPPHRLGRRVQQLHRPVRPVRHRHRQPPGAAVAVRVPLRPLGEPGRRPDPRRGPERHRSRARGPQRRARTASSAWSPRATTGLWQDQTGGPSDPQPGNIPGGARDVLRSADFGDGQLNAFAVDSGAWAVTQGTLSVEAASLGQDAAAVWYHDEYLPVYYEMVGRVYIEKPTGGWKANANVIFDYFGPTDFKFAGLDQSINKLVMGYRDATGWHVVAQSPVLGSVSHSKWYDMVVAVNGSTVTVLVNGTSYFTYTFGARHRSTASPTASTRACSGSARTTRGAASTTSPCASCRPTSPSTAARTSPTALAQWLDPETGTWAIGASRYSGSATAGLGVALADLGRQVAYDAYLELDTVGSRQQRPGRHRLRLLQRHRLQVRGRRRRRRPRRARPPHRRRLDDRSVGRLRARRCRRPYA